MNKRGIALIVSFMVIIALVLLSSAITSKSISERSIAQRYIESSQAFWLAEAGAANALLQLRGSFNNLNSIAATSLGAGQYSVDTIAIEGSFRRVTAHGFIPSAAQPRLERKVTVLVQSSGSGGGNPSLITYALETSGTLKITGSVNLNPSGSSHAGSALTFEQVFGMIEAQVKDIAVSAQSQGTGHVYTNPPANQQPLNGITWVELTGSNRYNISSDWSGSGLLIVNSNGNDIALDISGSWNFTGMIWVDGRIKISGTPVITGSIFARSSIDTESSLSGNATINFNSSEVTGAFGFLDQAGGGEVKVLSWREL